MYNHKSKGIASHPLAYKYIVCNVMPSRGATQTSSLAWSDADAVCLYDFDRRLHTAYDVN